MALHTRLEFANLCGWDKTNALNSYITRGKVVVSGKYIDDSIQENIDFIKYHQEQNGVKSTTQVLANTSQDQTQIQTQTPQKKKQTEPKVDKPAKGESFYELDRIKKQLDIEKTKEQTEILKIQKDKMKGMYIDYDTVLSLLVIHSESIRSAWEAGMEDFIIKFSAMNKLPREQLVELKKEFTITGNMATKRFVENSKAVLRRVKNVLANEKGIVDKE